MGICCNNILFSFFKRKKSLIVDNDDGHHMISNRKIVEGFIFALIFNYPWPLSVSIMIMPTLIEFEETNSNGKMQ